MPPGHEFGPSPSTCQQGEPADGPGNGSDKLARPGGAVPLASGPRGLGSGLRDRCLGAPKPSSAELQVAVPQSGQPAWRAAVRREPEVDRVKGLQGMPTPSTDIEGVRPRREAERARGGGLHPAGPGRPRCSPGAPLWGLEGLGGRPLESWPHICAQHEPRSQPPCNPGAVYGKREVATRSAPRNWAKLTSSEGRVMEILLLTMQ